MPANGRWDLIRRLKVKFLRQREHKNLSVNIVYRNHHYLLWESYNPTRLTTICDKMRDLLTLPPVVQHVPS